MNETIEALERFEPEPYVPPLAVVGVILALAIGGAVTLWTWGFLGVEAGPEQLSRTLLDVRMRTEAPVDFELETMSGETVALSDFDDKVVFLNFWATWCPPCVEEMPSLRRLYAKLKDNPEFVFLAVSTDEEWSAVRRFFESEPAAFPVLLDAKGEIARAYGTTKFPETYVIDHGRLVGHIIGPRDWDRWYAEGWLREML